MPLRAAAVFGTGFDGVRFYGSGSASDGGVQADSNLNLGNYRSATELSTLAVFGAMERITIGRVGEANDPGDGSIESDGTGRIRWTAPAETEPSAWVGIADGQTVVLESVGSPGSGLRVTRSGAAPAAGSRTLKLLDIYNGEIGCRNVSDAQRTAGVTVYRSLFLKNHSGSMIPFLRLRPNTSNVEIAREIPSNTLNGFVQTIASETTAPAALTWVTTSGAIEVWDWPAGEILGLWFKRVTAAGASANARVESEIIFEQYN